MGIFDNPNLESRYLLKQLQTQEQHTQRLIANLQRQEKSFQNQIIAIAKDVKIWNNRIKEAKAAKRIESARTAADKEAALRREGARLWRQMEDTKKRLMEAQKLLVKIYQKRQQVKAKADNFPGSNNVQQEFEQLEIDSELEQLKRNIGL
ncbi:MAG: hypothetical protein GDA44_02235 [Prochloron sp. SP5CPC1]|nr:hypothetical protein [Candidatus Paraprochloron terpiosi SP5CPC1]